MKVFISYAHEDKEIAKRLVRQLEDAGLEVWDDSSILPGDNWAEKISQALKESQAMVVLVSAAALDSEWVRREIDFALGTKEYRGRLIPVFVGPRDDIPEDKLPWILRRLHGVELTEQAEEESLEQVVNALSHAN
ncbi:MAG: toll/interleukin-1 receptor domain-containing protein [Sedimentisphaerales bacterium]|nr:toll/interleukin-1 receptor domain-containing protein [Sedimentisphaerales bacterium]